MEGELKVYVWKSSGPGYSQVLIIAATSIQEAHEIILEQEDDSCHYLTGCDPDAIVTGSQLVFTMDADWGVD